VGWFLARLAIRERRLEQAAALLGPAWRILQESDPDSLAVLAGGDPERAKRHTEDVWRWRDVQDSLATLALLSPVEGAERLGELKTAVSFSIEAARQAMRSGASGEERSNARRLYGAAAAAMDEARRVVVGD
jgi:hypothetical protein